MLYVFAAIVIVALLFLLVFNIVLARKERSRSSRPMPIEPSEQAEPIEAEQAPAPPLKLAKPVTPDANKNRAEGDHRYRQSLRSFAGTDRSSGEDPAAGEKAQTRDQEYRQALRTIDRKDQ